MDGQKVSDIRIMVEEIDFAESKNSGDSAVAEKKPGNDFLNVPEGLVEELPFS